jgi:hypothetical protein
MAYTVAVKEERIAPEELHAIRCKKQASRKLKGSSHVFVYLLRQRG